MRAQLRTVGLDVERVEDVGQEHCKLGEQVGADGRCARGALEARVLDRYGVVAEYDKEDHHYQNQHALCEIVLSRDKSGWMSE